MSALILDNFNISDNLSTLNDLKRVDTPKNKTTNQPINQPTNQHTDVEENETIFNPSTQNLSKHLMVVNSPLK